MRLRAPLIFFAVISISALHVQAQDKRCELTAEQSPSLRGLRLGMPVDEVEQLLKQVRGAVAPSHSAAEEKRGLLRVSIYPIAGQTNLTFINVAVAKLEFMNERVTAIGLHFDGGAPWATVDEFVDTVAETFALPSGWKARHSSGERRLDCRGFNLIVRKARSASLRLEASTVTRPSALSPPQRTF